MKRQGTDWEKLCSGNIYNIYMKNAYNLVRQAIEFKNMAKKSLT